MIPLILWKPFQLHTTTNICNGGVALSSVKVKSEHRYITESVGASRPLHIFANRCMEIKQVFMVGYDLECRTVHGTRWSQPAVMATVLNVTLWKPALRSHNVLANVRNCHLLLPDVRGEGHC